jgi:hypothetical protein
VSPAGTQRVVIVHEDMVWTTIHRTDKTDKDEAFADLFMDESHVIADRVAQIGGVK